MENLYKTAHGVNGELDKFFLVKEILDRVNGSILPSDSRLIPGLSVTWLLSLSRSGGTSRRETWERGCLSLIYSPLTPPPHPVHANKKHRCSINHVSNPRVSTPFMANEANCERTRKRATRHSRLF